MAKFLLTGTRIIHNGITIWYQGWSGRKFSCTRCMVIKPYGMQSGKIQAELDRLLKLPGMLCIFHYLFQNLFQQEADMWKDSQRVRSCYSLSSQEWWKRKGLLLIPQQAEEELYSSYIRTIIWTHIKTDSLLQRSANSYINGQCSEVECDKTFFKNYRISMAGGTHSYATREEAIEETEKMINVYATLLKFNALPVLKGYKSEMSGLPEHSTHIPSKPYAGWKSFTGWYEPFLGQNFAKHLMFSLPTDRKLDYVWATSWGVTPGLWRYNYGSCR